MEMEAADRPHNHHRHRFRFQFSIRGLILATAAAALLLVPVSWVARERQLMLRHQEAILRARELALRSVVREEEWRRGRQAPRAVAVAAEAAPEENGAESPNAGSAAGAPVRAVRALERENADLKRQVESLRREVDRLRNSPGAGAARRP